MTIEIAHRNARNALQKNGVPNSAFESICLMEHITGKSKSWILLNREFQLEQDKLDLLAQLVKRRLNREPLQYLLGCWDFYGRTFAVGPGVLSPRADTEIICEVIISAVGTREVKIVDLCAGCGCIGITLQLECDNSVVQCVELSEEAFPYLEQNIKVHGGLAAALHGDVLDPAVMHQAGKVDVIVCNPPYLTRQDMAELQPEVSYEPAMALYGEQDGLHYYREITRLWKDALTPGGMLFYEIGMGQEQAVMEILAENGLHSIGTQNDYNDICRVVHGMK